MRILGIDPGLIGGAVVIDIDAAPPVFSTIEIPVMGFRPAERRINCPAFKDWLELTSPIDHAFIEGAWVHPHQGAATGFRYGRAVGALEAVVACCNIPMTIVAPISWKKYHGLKGPDKEQSRQLVIRTMPRLGATLTRKMDHGIAEAALIATYGAWLLQQKEAGPVKTKARRRLERNLSDDTDSPELPYLGT